MSGQAITGLLERLAKRAGVRLFTPHHPRRSFVTSHLDRGTDAMLVATVVGHASVDPTKVYDRRGERAVIEAAGTVAFPW